MTNDLTVERYLPLPATIAYRVYVILHCLASTA